MRDNKALFPHVVFVSWTPSASASKEKAEKFDRTRKTASVPFANPGNIMKGFVNATFDIDYQFIECSGELHIAYSVIDDSVRQKKPGYFLEGRHYLLDKPAPATVLSLPITGTVWRKDSTKELVGRFADDAAGKALGFGCFSGQTKEVAKIAELNIGGSAKPSKEALKKFLNALYVEFKTPEVLTSASVEAEIRAGHAQATGAPTPGDDAVLEREQRAAISAEKRAKYERELAEHERAVADFAEAQRKMEADKSANAARVKAVQEEFARQQAAHRAELERHAKAQAEYEAQVAGQASVKVPKN